MLLVVTGGTWLSEVAPNPWNNLLKIFPWLLFHVHFGTKLIWKQFFTERAHFSVSILLFFSSNILQINQNINFPSELYFKSSYVRGLTDCKEDLSQWATGAAAPGPLLGRSGCPWSHPHPQKRRGEWGSLCHYSHVFCSGLRLLTHRGSHSQLSHSGSGSCLNSSTYAPLSLLMLLPTPHGCLLIGFRRQLFWGLILALGSESQNH